MKIPVVFAFDDNYALPASVAIQSLLATRAVETQYDIIVFHGGLREEIIRKFNDAYPVRWILATGFDFKSLPIGWSGVETWYRLMMADLLPEYDKVIWSDVDVLFKGDLSAIYKMNLEDSEWAGIKMENAVERQGVHNHFMENANRAIYAPGFMIANTKLWRERQFLLKCRNIVGEFGDRLTFFDLDLLNLAAESIGDIPFAYCVLDSFVGADKIEDAKEYPWLERAHGREALLRAIENPMIIHYAGCGTRLKPWERIPQNITADYWYYLSRSPFYDKHYYFPRCGSFANWCLDVMRFVLTKNAKRKAVARTHLTHWENMMVCNKQRLALSIVRFLWRCYRA